MCHRWLWLLASALAIRAQTPEQRAIDYLRVEVPRWSRENGCFSCHNNGDAARALFAARDHGMKVPREALADTLGWLSRPAVWQENKGNPAFSDKKLARLQFAAALADAGVDARALREAAEQIVAEQEADGSWIVDASTPAGSPVTWGTALATFLTRQTLERAGGAPESVAKATAWLQRLTPSNVPEAAVKLMAIPDAGTAQKMLLDAQSPSDGGWGPIRGAPSEVFDTALTMLALRNARFAGDAVGRGRKFLIATQLRDGGWPGTTRPTGGQSYAQHISTTGWAAIALILTKP
ncbi:MAG TPA: hypothetical protein VGP79_13035 [Bryobacteraceae bacterium]|nr:hypothetical protein [Bryobacteraceae bacterium]